MAEVRYSEYPLKCITYHICNFLTNVSHSILETVQHNCPLILYYIQDSPKQQRESPDHDADDYEEMQMARRGSFTEEDEDVYQNY